MNIYSSCLKDRGQVGMAYWRQFMHRNAHLIKSKPGRQFSVDRSNWSNYLNFRDMYLHIMEVMCNEYKIATKLDEPIWVNDEGVEVKDEEDSTGFKCPIRIDRPDMAIVFDEVGSNLSQENDGAVGGERYLCPVSDQPYQSAATKSTHFTCLGVTRLDGVPLMCVVIIAGKRRDIMVEAGIDWSKLNDVDLDELEDGDVFDFFEKNYGKDDVFPGGPSCYFKDKEIPAFVTFTESGGIDGWTLREIFPRIDRLGIYDSDRAKGIYPFALLDGHQSRFDYKFLEYINDPTTKWNVTIGVPYGTAKWQVGDSSEQNGVFKMDIAKEKRNLFNDRLDCFQQKLHLMKTDILPLVTKSWKKAFANILNNLKAIRARGWDPYNMVLLLDPSIRASMTEDLQSKCSSSRSFIRIEEASKLPKF